MDKLADFIINNYVLFIILAIVAFFALIGYFTKPDDEALKFLSKNKKEKQDTELEKTLKEIEDIKNKQLNQSVNEHSMSKKDVKQEEKPAEDVQVEQPEEVEDVPDTLVLNSTPKVVSDTVKNPRKEAEKKSDNPTSPKIEQPEEEIIDTLAFDTPLMGEEKQTTTFKG